MHIYITYITLPTDSTHILTSSPCTMSPVQLSNRGRLFYVRFLHFY